MKDYIDLITQIVATNNSWHASEYLFSNNSPILEASRSTKSRLQLRLLRNFCGKVYLELDKGAEGEDLYSIKLRSPVTVEIGADRHTRIDATHLPVRVMKDWVEKKMVNEQELQSWLGSNR